MKLENFRDRYHVFMKLDSLLSVRCRHHSVKSRLGTEFSDYDRRTGDTKTKPKTVFCPGFQKGRVPSEKGTLARWTDRQKGTLARWTDRQKGTLARWTEEKGHN